MEIGYLDYDQTVQFGNLITGFSNSYPCINTQQCPTGDVGMSNFIDMTTSSNPSELSDLSEQHTFYTELCPIKAEILSEQNISDHNNNMSFDLLNFPNQEDFSDDSSVDLSDVAFLNCQSNTQADDLTHGTCLDLNYIKQETNYEEIDESRLPSFSKLVSSVIHSKKTKFHQYSSDEHELSEEEDENVMCKKGKRGAKNILLWKFLLEQLEGDQGLIRWIDQRGGKFRFVDTIEISRQWGEKKRKSDMNFEKLSRAIRHYYRSGFMSRCEGTRLVYKINWRMVPKQWRQRFITR